MSLRLRVTLPVVQVLIAGALMQWEYRTPSPRGSEYFSPPARLLRLGLDAPARPIWLLDPDVLFDAVSTHPAEGPVFPWLPQSMLGFNRDDVLFLIGTAITWYLAGRALDQRIAGVSGGSSTVRLALAYLFLLGFGVCLFGTGFHDLGPNRAESTIPPVGAVFTLIWAAIMVFIPVRGAIRVVREREGTRAS